MPKDADLGEGLGFLVLRRSSTLPPLPPSARFQSPSTLPTIPKSASLRSLISLRSSSIDSVRKPNRFPNVEQELNLDLLKKLSRWIVCLALVEFDQDIGADLDCIYPSVDFSPELRSNIAFSSLPEGELTTSGAHTYSWRIKNVEKEVTKSKTKLNNDEFLHGFVYYNSLKSDTLRRGSSQRSLVLITRNHSLVGLYSTIISVLGALYFKECRGDTIEAACSEIACWPDLIPGSTLDLPFLGTIHTVSIPLASQPQWPISQLHATSPLPIPASIPLTPLSVNFHDNILNVSKILLLWELVILGEPILISSKDPRSGSELVHHLRNFIRPLLMKGDYRPYLHIHDSDFALIVNTKKPPPPATIISSTNPLVLSTCTKNSHSWPHILKIGSASKGSSGALGLNSSRKRTIKKDKHVTSEVEKAFGRGDYLRSDELIFQHLATLTEQFLAPLNRYFSTLFLLDNSLDSPNLSNHFLPIQFLSSLSSHGTPLLFRSTTTANIIVAQKFYTAFLQSSNFQPWFDSRISSIGSERRSSYLRRLVETDLKSWMSGRPDGEVDELAGRIQREVKILEEEEENAAGEGVKDIVGVERVRNLRNQASRLNMLRGEREAGYTDSESDVGSIH